MGQRLISRVQSDHIERISAASIFDAVEELVFNAFDENPTQVEVKFSKTGLDDVTKIVIRDDGNGMSYDDAKDAFGKIGSSRKRERRAGGEHLHGRKGEGRHRAFSLGRKVIWTFTYRRRRQLYSYTITGTAGKSNPFYLGDERKETERITTGCAVEISDTHRSKKKLYPLLLPSSVETFTAVFAIDLLGNPNRTLTYNGRKISPRDAIASKKKMSVTLSHDGEKHKVDVSVFDWKNHSHRGAFLCGKDGIKLHELSDSFLGRDHRATVLLSSDLFDDLHQSNELATFESSADEEQREAIRKLKNKVRKHFVDQRKSAGETAIDELKREGSYPYRHDPRSEIEKVERGVFDVCAIEIHSHLPNFTDGMDVSGRQLVLQLVKEAVTQEPSAVGKIIREVCKLSGEQAKKFANLLDDVPLSNVVEAAHRIAKRLEFLKSLKAIVYLNPFEERIKERVGLQQLISGNT